ncbi:hypothetical protein D6D20_02432 [Aureobasidium pullulans]|uniref:Helicase C-terminal domain-containing protein n=1 Tax=Aureobasidium pullulans TaxID=5580 RepID=A0A4S8ZGN5_AURPU|nr:hypothetical protein D6D20_02432 [Aureobasidium pullulans]
MSFTNRKIKKFDLPDGIQSIIVEDEPDQEYSNEDHEPKSENPIKTEPEDNQHPDKDMDINEYMGANTSTPYVEITTEPDVQAGAEEEIQSAQESASVSAIPTVPITPVGLGNSILNAPKIVQVSTIQSDDQKEALQRQQAALYAQMASYGGTGDDDGSDFDPQEDSEDPIAQECQFMEAKNIYLLKKQNGELTQDDEMDFLQRSHAYDKRKRELHTLLEEIDQESLFVPEELSRKSARKTRKRSISEFASDSENSTMPSSRSSSKKAKTAKSQSRKNSRRPLSSKLLESSSLNLGGHNNFWEDVAAASQMDAEPTLEGVDRGGRRAAIEDLRGRLGKKAAALDMHRLKQAMKSFVGKKGFAKNHRSIEPVKGGWKVKGMNTPLKNYQLINCGWMRSREIGAKEPKGGIIADQMGLGKTVTCLANIVNGRPLKSFPPHLQPKSRTTLIVVPSSLLGQWKAEIKRHTKREVKRQNWGLGRVKVFRDNESEDHEPIDFSSKDIILTTYYDVRQSWPDDKYPEGLSEDQKHAYWLQEILNKRGPLHRFPWLRVVLDEGHQIANPETQIASACFNLIAEYKWILTGTPMVNGSKDLYSLLYFIGHPTVLKMKFESFKSRFCNTKNPMSLDALSQEMVESVACFTHKDKLFNARLITLPKPHNMSVTLNPSKLESEIYNVVRARFRARAQTLNAEGELKSSKFHIWAMHTLLRQMTAHPLLVPTRLSDYLELEDFERLRKAVDRQALPGETSISMIHALRAVVKRQRARTEARLARGGQSDTLGSPGVIDELDEGADDVDELRQPDIIEENQDERGTGGEHGRNVNVHGYLESLRRSTNFHVSNKRSICCKCKREASVPVMTPCFHFYCRVHMEDMMHEAAEKRLDHMVCVNETCGEKFIKTDLLNPEDAFKPKWLDADGKVLPSTKTLAIKAQILNWFDIDSKSKVIVFTQWKSFLGMVSRICEIEGWGYTTLHGSMNKKARDASIEKFKTDPETRILIATLKTGGQGLNLTCACYTINVDPYWNTAGEIQAFSRTYRIGQEKETEFVNLTLAGTVNAGHKRMTMEELLKTFEPTEDSEEDFTSD